MTHTYRGSELPPHPPSLPPRGTPAWHICTWPPRLSLLPLSHLLASWLLYRPWASGSRRQPPLPGCPSSSPSPLSPQKGELRPSCPALLEAAMTMPLVPSPGAQGVARPWAEEEDPSHCSRKPRRATNRGPPGGWHWRLQWWAQPPGLSDKAGRASWREGVLSQLCGDGRRVLGPEKGESQGLPRPQLDCAPHNGPCPDQQEVFASTWPFLPPSLQTPEGSRPVGLAAHAGFCLLLLNTHSAPRPPLPATLL